MQVGRLKFSWLRRREFWLFWVALLIGLRIALPSILRWVLVREASSLLRTRVELGDVDLSLLRGGIALENVAVDDPQAGKTGSVQHPAALITWKRFAVELHWLPLLRRVVQLRLVSIEEPRIALERLKDGALNLAALVPKSAPAESTPPVEPPAGSPPRPWGFGIDHVDLRSGALDFRDRMVDESEPVEVSLERIEVADIALRPGVYGEPSHVHVDLKLDDAIIGVDARLELREQGIFLETAAKAEHFPLRRARVYIPNVGWSDLQGVLDADVAYRLETNVRDQLRGKIRLRDVTVRSASFDRPALAWKDFEVQIDPLDLLNHSVNLQKVSLSGADVLVRLGSDSPLPAFAPAASAAGPTSPSPSPQPTPEPTPASAAPWQWAVQSLHLDDSRVHLLSDPVLDISVALDSERLTSAGDQAVPLKLAAHLGDGSLAVDGNLRLKPPGLAGQIKIEQFDLPTPLTALHAGPPGLVSSARLESELDVAVGSLSPTPGDLNIHGSVGLSALQITPPGAAENKLAANHLNLALDDLHLTALLDDADRPRDLTLRGRLDLETADLSRGGSAGLAAGAKSIQIRFEPLELADLSSKTGAHGDLSWHGAIGLVEPHLNQSGEQPMSVAAAAIDLGIEALQLRGLLEDRSAPSNRIDTDKLAWTGTLAITDLNLNPEKTDAASLNIAKLDLAARPFELSGLLDGSTSASAGSGDLQWNGSLSLGEVKFAAGARGNVDASLHSLALVADPLQISALLAAAARQPQPSDGDFHWRGSLAIATPHLGSGSNGAALDAGNVALNSTDLKVNGLVSQNSASNGDAAGQTSILVNDLRLAAADSKSFSLAVKAIDLPLDDLKLPGLLARSGTHDAAASLRLGAIHINSPNLRLTRTTDGIVVPSLGPAADKSTASSAAAAPPTSPPSKASAPMTLLLRSLDLKQGSITFSDRTTKPFFTTVVDTLNLEAKTLRFPGLRLASARVDATLKPQGTVHLTGAIDDNSTIELNASQIELPPFNPYARAYSSYTVPSGSLNVTTKVSTAGQTYKTQTELTLHDFDVAGSEGDSLFQQTFGIPLTVALALLRDLAGNIVFNIPVEVTNQGTKVDLVAVLGGALRAAIVNALASPLKLAGAVFQGSKVTALLPPALALRPGRPQLTPESTQQLDQLGALLADRPAMAVTLDTTASTVDARWLQEQALLQELSQSQGILATLRQVGQGGTRDAIRKALEARANDGKGELDPKQEQTLEQWLAERPAIPPERLQKLSTERLAQLQEMLSKKHGIASERVDLIAPAAASTDNVPVVHVQLHPVGKPLVNVAPTQEPPNTDDRSPSSD